MADNKHSDDRNAVENINDKLTGLEQKVQNNQRLIMWICVAVAAVVLLAFGYMYGIHRPSVAAANEAIAQADAELMQGNDSTAVELYRQVADNHGHDAGNRAALNAAILLYQQGKYEDALTYLNKYSTKEDVIGPAALSLKGDCYVNLDKLPEAADCFAAAVKASNRNQQYTPYFLMKEATVLHEMKKYKEAAAAYETIERDYPRYVDEQRLDIVKYKERELALTNTQGE